MLGEGFANLKSSGALSVNEERRKSEAARLGETDLYRRGWTPEELMIEEKRRQKENSKLETTRRQGIPRHANIYTTEIMRMLNARCACACPCARPFTNSHNFRTSSIEFPQAGSYVMRICTKPFCSEFLKFGIRILFNHPVEINV